MTGLTSWESGLPSPVLGLALHSLEIAGKAALIYPLPKVSTGGLMEDHLDVAELKQRLRGFASAREWERFHSPKNLVMALVAEAAELPVQDLGIHSEDVTGYSTSKAS